jgi:hypothetical protein
VAEKGGHWVKSAGGGMSFKSAGGGLSSKVVAGRLLVGDGDDIPLSLGVVRPGDLLIDKTGPRGVFVKVDGKGLFGSKKQKIEVFFGKTLRGDAAMIPVSDARIPGLGGYLATPEAGY